MSSCMLYLLGLFEISLFETAILKRNNLTVKLLYLTETNLNDRLLIRDLVHNVKFKEKAILVHDAYKGNLTDTRFVNKRISALMSEAMVYNNAFCGEQRSFFKQEGDEILPNKKLIEQLFPPIQLLILGPTLKKEEKITLTDPLELVASLRKAYEIEEVILFPKNPLSPMVSKVKAIRNEEDRDKLLAIYGEEKEALELAFDLRPSLLASPANYSLALE